MEKWKLKFAIILVVLVLFFTRIFGQDVISKQVWLDYNPSWAVSNKLLVYGDIGVRTVFPNSWYRLNARLSLNYKPFVLSERKSVVKNIQFHMGVGDFLTYYLNDTNINELRLIQGIRVYWPTRKRIRMSHYLRIEERIEDLLNDNVATISVRMRYQLKAVLRFKKEKIQNLYFPLSAEFFMPLAAGVYFNDVIRVTPAIGYDITDGFRTEFHFSYHYGRNSQDDSFENNDVVLRLRIFHVF